MFEGGERNKSILNRGEVGRATSGQERRLRSPHRGFRRPRGSRAAEVLRARQPDETRQDQDGTRQQGEACGVCALAPIPRCRCRTPAKVAHPSKSRCWFPFQKTTARVVVQR